MKARLAIVGMGIASVLCGAIANADPLLLNPRQSVYNITFSDLNFSNADARYDVTIGIPNTEAEPPTEEDVNTRTGFINFSASGTGGVTTTGYVAVPNSSVVLGQVATNGTSGNFMFGYDTLPPTLARAGWSPERVAVCGHSTLPAGVPASSTLAVLS